MVHFEDLLLDGDGVPVLTDIIEPQGDSRGAEPDDRRAPVVSIDDTIRAILDSATVRKQLDEIAGELTDNFRNEVEELLRPAIEQVVTEVMDDSRNATFDVIRGELRNRLPALLTEALQDAMDDNA